MIYQHTVYLLNGVLNERKYSNLFLNEYLNGLDNPTYKPQITHLFYSTLKNYLLFDTIIQKMITTRIKRKTHLVMSVALAQYYLSKHVKPYAIVNEAVDYTKKHCHQYDANVVNATLRNIFATYLDIEQMRADVDVNIQYSMPLWLYNLFVKQYSKEITMHMLSFFNSPSRLYARLLPGISFEDLKINYDVTLIDQEMGCVQFGDANIIDACKAKEVYIQDFSSQHVALLFELRDGMRILDMCSAPGGKLHHLATLNPNVTIVANDIHPHKAKILEKLVEEYAFEHVEVVCHDALKLSEYYEEASFDAILLDAPCSGLGVLGHKPEIKYRIQPEDLDALENLQLSLLKVAQALLKPSGTLVYSTCTLNKKENEKQIEKFVNTYKSMSILNQETLLGYPQHCDGFYFCKLIKEII